VITERSTRTHFEGLRTELLLTTFYDFLACISKKHKKSHFWNLKKNVKHVFSNTVETVSYSVAIPLTRRTHNTPQRTRRRLFAARCAVLPPAGRNYLHTYQFSGDAIARNCAPLCRRDLARPARRDENTETRLQISEVVELAGDESANDDPRRCLIADCSETLWNGSFSGAWSIYRNIIV